MIREETGWYGFVVSHVRIVAQSEVTLKIQAGNDEMHPLWLLNLYMGIYMLT